MGKKKINLLERPLTIEAVYEARPRLWWLYTLIVLIVVALLGWSGTTVEWEGFATKGIEVAKGVGNGLLHPDMSLLFNLTTEGVPYQLFQTVAIAVLGTIIGGLLAVPFSFLACDKIVPKGVAAIFQAVILLIRTIPSIVWALVWIRVTDSRFSTMFKSQWESSEICSTSSRFSSSDRVSKFSR